MDQIIEANIAEDIELGFAFLILSQAERAQENTLGEADAFQGAQDAILGARRTLTSFATPEQRARLELRVNELALAFRAFDLDRNLATSPRSVTRSAIGLKLAQKHICDLTCECRLNLDIASAALAQSSALLSASILSEPDELIEKYYALVRNAATRLSRAVESYKVHLAEFC
jgi:hypothetical protein